MDGFERFGGLNTMQQHKELELSTDGFLINANVNPIQ
jgi:hypothetical protein